ncbi:hypothetical protein Terro_1391 [Terriglobus roseus DSM 18391]|uniref:Uncharacterized protein n=1 Tax=Terriglobus roseus (strain DSM 18391 / NRRL B-41598 / KBS 63) TaxID=926566 RepID=I3ZEN2_TERRK|nr:hypothetical protein [Terriglobus roseus]AFL87700.1 hypothetical protein Terro_1391 [Terriglobus roseus DSM 18391]
MREFIAQVAVGFVWPKLFCVGPEQESCGVMSLGGTQEVKAIRR